MPKQFTKDFTGFINESNEPGFKGLPLEEFMPLFTKLVMLCPNLEKFDYPNDIHSHASSQITLSRDGTFDKGWMKTKEEGLSDMKHQLDTNAEFIQSKYPEKGSYTYYVWTVYTKGIQYNELETKLKEVGGLPNYQDIQLPKLIELLTNNEELKNAVTSISAGADSQGIRDFGTQMSGGDVRSLD